MAVTTSCTVQVREVFGPKYEQKDEMGWSKLIFSVKSRGSRMRTHHVIFVIRLVIYRSD